jgi:cytochrome c-type biogenesis protein CcmF
MGASVGRAALVIALGVCVYGIGAALYGARTGRREWVDSGRRSVYALAVIMTICFAILELAFVRSDFSFDTVAGHSSTTTPSFYKASAVWSSQEGSLLLWAWLLSLWSSAAIFLTRKQLRDVVPYATAVLLGFAAFFTGLLVFLATPFATTHPTPLEGVGLNPLLRHPSMMIHPPMLYSGYTLSTIPFAFAVGALIVRRVDAEWVRAIRRFALAAWFFLGIGVLLGARWSYAELGWGGYWAWDPVENAALMPWLVGTALIHSIMIQEKRGMLKVWNASLALATGTLAILGTFLVRSGILQSIHAFGASTLGTPFVILIAVLVASAVYLIVTRRNVLRSEHQLDSLLSRESVFLLNNLVLVGLCFVIFWGTFFPLISEAVTGQKASVGPPWFDRYTVPLALILVLLSGIGPVIAWRRATPANARRNFRVPVLSALGLLAVLLLLTDAGTSPWALGMFCCAAFVFGSVGQEFYRGVGARRAMSGEAPAVAAISLVRRNRRRYGGYIVHLGMALLFVGVAASSAFQATRDAQLSPGQSVTVGGYRYDYVRATASVDADPKNTGSLLDLGAVVNVSKGGRHVVTLYPSKGYYPAPDTSQGPVGSLIGSGEPTSHVALKAGLRRDIWSAIEPNIGALQSLIDKGNAVVPAAHPEVAFIVLAAIAQHYRNSPPPATFRLIVSPLVTWIWLGGFVVLLGALIAMWPGPGRPVRARYLARVGRELKQAKQAHAPA